MTDIIKGRAWFITDSNEKLIDNIDTDQIFHNSHLAITDISKMGEYAFGNLKGWENFSKKARNGDIIIAGENFGSGSSRQQAVDCFRSLKVNAIIAKSFGSIYKRNAINSGFLVLVCENIDSIMKKQHPFSENLEIEVNLENGNITEGKTPQVIGIVKPLSKVEKEIYKSGDIFNYGKNLT